MKTKKKAKAGKKQYRETLFPLPHNRIEKPTDANVLLHAICIAIRDGSSHAKLRKIIAHLPKIMNRANPYTAEHERFVALEQQNIELSNALKVAAQKFKKLEAGNRLAPEGAKRYTDTGGESILPPQVLVTHPDREGGSPEAFDRVVKAKDMALQLIK